MASHQIAVETLTADTFAEQLKLTLAKAPTLFQSAPCVLDVTALGTDVNETNLHPILETCRSLSLVPFALTGSKDLHEPLAKSLQLAWVDFKAGSTPKASNALRETKVVSTPVRSGQQIYAPNANLLVTSHVSAGAEVAADGNIHVLGALRGRAIAGATGNGLAEIICQDMKAELVSIAGLYLVHEDFPDGAGAARCRLEGDKLEIDFI